MVIGIILLLVTAFLWIGIGGVQGYGGRKQLNLALLQSVPSALLVLIYSIYCTFTHGWGVPHLSFLIAMPLAGAVNFFAMIAMGKAMKRGPNGIVWALIQSALVMPFAMGVLFFHVPCSAGRFAGLCIILLSMILMGIFSRNNDTQGEGRKWMLLTFAGFCLAGTALCLSNIPSYFVKSDGDAGVALRTILFQGGTLIAFLIFYGKDKKSWQGFRPARGAILILTLVNLISMLTMLWGLDRLAVCNLGALGYPVLIGTSNIVFFLYTAIVLHEKLNLPSILSMFLGVGGIALLILQ